MRDTVIGVFLAVVFLAAMFAVSQIQPHTSGPFYAQAAADVKPGFVGVKQVGPWQLACGQPNPAQAAASKNAIPFSLNPDPKSSAATASAAQNPLARCRATYIRRKKGDPKAVVLVMSFRYTQDQRGLALIVRFPALGQKGDNLIIRISKQAGIKLPVAQCSPTEGCLAAGLLQQDGQNLILGAKQGVIVFPAKKGDKPLGMLVPFIGLKDALDAIRRAES